MQFLLQVNTIFLFYLFKTQECFNIRKQYKLTILFLNSSKQSILNNYFIRHTSFQLQKQEYPILKSWTENECNAVVFFILS